MPFAALLAYADECEYLNCELQRIVSYDWNCAVTLGEQKATIAVIIATAVNLQMTLNRDTRPDTARTLGLLRADLDPAVTEPGSARR